MYFVGLFKFFLVKYIVLSQSLCSSGQSMNTVNSSKELENAIDNAKPGETIILGPITFEGEFTLKQKGIATSPITIKGIHHKTKFIGNGKGTAFTMLGDYWNLLHFPISGYDTGVSVKGTGNMLGGLSIQNADKAVNIEGKATKVNGCTINSYKDYGIGIQASNNTVLAGNTIQGGKYPSIIIEDGTCCGIVSGSTASNGLFIKGSDYSFSGNVIQGSIEVTGCGNSFVGQVSSHPNFTKRCKNKDLGGNVFY